MKYQLTFFLHRLSDLPYWDTEHPLKTFFQDNQLWLPMVTEDRNLLGEERLLTLLVRPKLRSEFLDILASEGKELERLIKLAAFFPQGLSISTLQKLGFDSENIRSWIHKGFLYEQTTPRHKKRIVVFFLWSYLTFSPRDYHFPPRRYVLPLTILLQFIQEDSLNKLISDIETIARNGKDVSFLSWLRKSILSFPEDGKKIAVGLSLQILYKLLKKSDWDDILHDLAKENLVMCFFADDESKFQISLISFIHPFQGKKIGAFPLEVPKKIIQSLHQIILPTAIELDPISFQEVYADQCNNRRIFFVNILKQILFLTAVMKPEKGSQIPDIHTLSFAGHFPIDHGFVNQISRFLIYEGFIFRTGQYWQARPGFISIDDVTPAVLANAFYQFIMWQPGLSFIHSPVEVERQYFDRILEQIKVFILVYLSRNKSRFLSLNQFLFIENQNNSNGELFSVLLWESLYKLWQSQLEEFGTSWNEIVQKILNFLDQLGWIQFTEKNRQQIYIPQDFPDWSPFVSDEEALHSQGSAWKPVVNFINETDFEILDAGVKDMVFIYSWADLLYYGEKLIFRVSRTKTEEFLSQGNHFHEIDDYFHQVLRGAAGDGYNRIKNGLQNRPSSAIFYQMHSVLIISKQNILLERLFSDQQFQECIVQYFASDKQHIFLYHPEMFQRLQKLIGSHKIIWKIEETSGSIISLMVNDVRPFDLSYDYILAKRLMLFYDKHDDEFDQSTLESNASFVQGELLSLPRVRSLLKEAIDKNKKIEIQYFAKSKGYESLFRVVKPYYIQENHLIGFCFLREDERVFALNRIGAIKILS